MHPHHSILKTLMGLSSTTFSICFHFPEYFLKKVPQLNSGCCEKIPWGGALNLLNDSFNDWLVKCPLDLTLSEIVIFSFPTYIFCYP